VSVPVLSLVIAGEKRRRREQVAIADQIIEQLETEDMLEEATNHLRDYWHAEGSPKGIKADVIRRAESCLKYCRRFKAAEVAK